MNASSLGWTGYHWKRHRTYQPLFGFPLRRDMSAVRYCFDISFCFFICFVSQADEISLAEHSPQNGGLGG